MLALCNLASQQILRGRLREAATHYYAALETTTVRPSEEHWAHGHPFVPAGYAHVGLAELLYEWNDLDAARRHALEGIELCRQGWNRAMILNSYLALARIHQAQGDLAGTHEAIRKAEQLTQDRIFPGIVARMGAVLRTHLARIQIKQGNIQAASRWAQECGLRIDEPLDEEYAAEYITLARVWIAQSKPDDALTLLERLRHAAEAADKCGNLIEILALQAIALHLQGEGVEAMTVICRALKLAAPSGYVRTFVDEDAVLPEILAGLVVAQQHGRFPPAADVPSAYVRLLVAAVAPGAPPIIRPVDALGSEPTTSTGQPTAAFEPLSEREREVLRLVGTGLSNQQIAQELVVGVSTVKWHLKNIYAKLNVHSRTQAIVRAGTLSATATPARQ